MNDDTISRQAAINALDDVLVEDDSCKVWFKLALKQLPSAERLEAQSSECKYWDSESNFCSLYRPYAVRRGRWIEIRNVAFPHLLCSECKKPFYGSRSDVWNYCPNCGARMEAE